MPYPQGKAGSSKKAAKVSTSFHREHITWGEVDDTNLFDTEPSHREAFPQLRHWPGCSAQAQPVPLRQVARICPPPAPEEDSEHASEGSPFNRSVPEHPGPQHRCPDLQAPRQVPP